MRTFSPKFFMFPMPSCLNDDWIHALGKGFSGSMHPMNSAALLYSLLKYAFTVDLEIPCKTCYHEAVPKRRGQLTRAWNIRWNASCIGKLESKTTSAKIFQSKMPMMSHSLHSWSRQDGLLPQEFVSPLLHKIPGTFTTIGQLHVRKFLARARSFFAITS